MKNVILSFLQSFWYESCKIIGNFIRYLKLLILTICRTLCEILKSIGLGSSQKQVLFVGESQLMVSYLKEIWQRLNDDRLSLNVTFDTEIDSKVIIAETAVFAASPKRIRRVSYRFAMIWPWDLIVFADCTTAWKSFSGKLKKLKVDHGINAGKLSRNGGGRQWSEWLVKKNKTPAFDMIFTPDENMKTNGEMKCPFYRGRIAAVGNLRFDNLLEACQNRKQIKKEFGFHEGKKVVLCISSWGPKSLLHTVGEQLYLECSKLADKYYFILTAHPNNYDRDKTWIDVMQKQKCWGAEVLSPNEDYVNSLSIADVLITDFTSLSLYFVPLLRPVISIPISPDFGVPGSNMYKMESIATRLERPYKLKDALETAFSSEISDENRAFAKELVSHRGRAWIEMRKRIYELLSFSEPA